ncbi:MAG: hypothetical protein J5J00_14950 [Deltaproteobacteria bacterium]|nr:hypothetical protein [Deltaproteobacteria bacterium]
MNGESLAWLARKQKRLKDWKTFADTEIQDAGIRKETKSKLLAYAAVLERVWENQSLDAASAEEIDELERVLEQLNEEARLRVVGKRQAKAF